VLELDHVIHFVPDEEAADLTGYTPGPSRVHTGQGTRNVRVLFERNYLEVIWVENPDEVAARGLDFLARCARPATATPFGCVLRGEIAAADRARFTPYELPDAPGVILHILAEQTTAAPFIAVFEVADREARWPLRHFGPDLPSHPCGATQIVRAKIAAPELPPITGVADVSFAVGEPRLHLDLGTTATTRLP
jgi:hypothetical protein